MAESREERSSGECEMLSQELYTVATVCVWGGGGVRVIGTAFWGVQKGLIIVATDEPG